MIDSIMFLAHFASKQDKLINVQGIAELWLWHNDIYNAINEVNNRLASISAKFDLVIASTAIASMESDLKNLVQYLKTALEITLLKSKVALAAAQNSRTSPYTLLQTELIKFVTEMHLKIRYTIDSNINNTHTTAIVVKNTFVSSLKFHFWTLTNISIFTHSEKYQLFTIMSCCTQTLRLTT